MKESEEIFREECMEELKKSQDKFLYDSQEDWPKEFQQECQEKILLDFLEILQLEFLENSWDDLLE